MNRYWHVCYVTSFRYTFTLHILYVMNRYWHVCYVIFFCFTFAFHILHVIMIRYLLVCYLFFFLFHFYITYCKCHHESILTFLLCYFFFALHFYISYLICRSWIETGMFVMFLFFITLLHFIHYMSSWVDTDMYVTLFFFHCTFIFREIHVAMNWYWYVCYVIFSFLLQFYISYITCHHEYINVCYVNFF